MLSFKSSITLLGTIDINLQPIDITVKSVSLNFLLFMREYSYCVTPALSSCRVPCSKTGGIRFTLNGSPYYLSILVSNVGGFGDVQALSIKGSNSGSFESLTQNWGQVWSLSQPFVGQELSFGATVGDTSYEQKLTFSNVVPSNWQFGTTYEANSNF